MKNLLSKIEREKLDDLPTKDKIRIPADRWGRYRQDYPHTKVWRFFRSQVGHNWDEVYSKYCKLDWVPKQYRNMEQVRWVVTVDTFLKDGEVCFIDWQGERSVASTYYRKEVLYVHPETKILCLYSGKHVDWKKKRQEELDKKLRILGEYWQLYKKDGIWYEVKGTPVLIEQFGLERKSPKDILLESNSDWYNKTTKYPFVKIVQKRQLSRKELKKHGLKNML